MDESTRVPEHHKWCNIGLHVKPLSEFGRNSQRLDGYMGACRACVNDANRQSYWRARARTGRQKPVSPVPVPEGCKRCTKGDHVKPLGEFARRTDQPGKYTSACRECINMARRKPSPPPVPPGHKRCSRGNHVKPLGEFARRSDGRGDGYLAKCRDCEREYRRERFHDPTLRPAYDASAARWNARNPTYQADYYRRTRESKIPKTAAYKKINPTDPVKQREYEQAWAKRDPEGYREKGRRSNRSRRARLMDRPSEKFTTAQIIERDGTDCVLCEKVLNFAVSHRHPMSPTIEHLECLSWPDSAGDVLSNVALSHRTCNEKRGTKPHPAAARKRAELLAAEQELIT